MSEPVYLIVNVHRSGSSMLMRCLEAGGLQAVGDKNLELNSSAPLDYIPNPNGFYQFNNLINDNFYSTYAGKLIKYPIRKIRYLPSGEYKIILLKRNPEEIRMSMSKWTPYKSWGKDETITYLYEEYIDLVLNHLSSLAGAEISVMDYKDIVQSPKQAFAKLVDAGWPIDTESAAQVVDQSLYRLKLESNG